MTAELCYLPAVEALKLFKRRKLSPVELLQAQIARAETAEPVINAFTETYYEEALAQARKAEARYMKKAARLRPLEGLSLVVKDEARIKGKRYTSGSLLYRDRVADETEIFIDRLLKAGAICHARGATPEFCCAAVTHSRLHGVSRNPWNKRYTPGGSSGGSAASLAAGTTTLATGSDIAGSIRIPASCCGVVGFKPPYGRVPEGPVFNLDFYCHEGPLARTVADTVLMQNIIAGPHPLDIASIKPKLRIPEKLGSIRGFKIAYSLDLGYFKLDPDVRANTLAALETFRALGCHVEEVDLGWNAGAGKAAWDYLSLLFGGAIAGEIAGKKKLLTGYARAFAENAVRTKGTDFVKSLEVAWEMNATFQPLMQRYDVFICPTLAKPAVRADDPLDYGDYKKKGKTIPDGLGWVMTYPFNMLSRCPVLSLPSGLSRRGVPTGIQVVGRSYDDVRVFRAAAAFEKAAPWMHDKAHRPKI